MLIIFTYFNIYMLGGIFIKLSCQYEIFTYLWRKTIIPIREYYKIDVCISIALVAITLKTLYVYIILLYVKV